MNREKKFLLAAYKTSFLSKNKYPIGAVLVIGHRIISKGFNRVHKSHPKQPAFISYSGRTCIEPHAELDTLIRAPYEIIRGSTIYLARRLCSGMLGLSRPCRRCSKLLEAYGVKNIVYTIGGDINNILFEKSRVTSL